LEEYERDPAYSFERVFLSDVVRALGEQKLLLVFDEFQAFEDKIRREELEPGFLPFLRHWMQFGERVCFAFSGPQAMEDLDRSLWEVFFNLAINYPLGLLKPEESRQLLTAPVEFAGITYDSPALDRIARLTGHHPYFVQRMGSEVVDELNRRRQTLVNVATVDAAAQRLIDQAAMQLRFIWDELNEKQRAVAAAVQEQFRLQGDPTRCRWEDVWEWMAGINPNVPQDEFRDLIYSLEAMEVLHEDGGTLRFVVGLVQEYIGQHVPTRETRERIHNLW
jgi:hypothetical protein